MTHTEIREAATDTHKHCSRCGEFKALDEFPEQERGFLGRMAWCLLCWREYRAEHGRRPAQRERRNAYLRSPDGYRTLRMARMRALFGERLPQQLWAVIGLAQQSITAGAEKPTRLVQLASSLLGEGVML